MSESQCTCDFLRICYTTPSPLVINLCVVFRWRGDYGGKKQLWFPANYVEEVPSSPTRELDEAVSSDFLNGAKCQMINLSFQS